MYFEQCIVNHVIITYLPSAHPNIPDHTLSLAPLSPPSQRPVSGNTVLLVHSVLLMPRVVRPTAGVLKPAQTSLPPCVEAMEPPTPTTVNYGWPVVLRRGEYGCNLRAPAVSTLSSLLDAGIQYPLIKKCLSKIFTDGFNIIEVFSSPFGKLGY